MTSNWAGNLTYRARGPRLPTSVPELQDLVASTPRVRALGTRHSFNDVADTPGLHVQVGRIDDGRPPVQVADDGATVSVNAGLRYGEVSEHLQARGLALHNMASLPHISVAGAVATATHGSGDGNKNLASAVVGLEMVTGSGELLRLSRGDAEFPGAVVSLGALGIVTRLVLDVVPTFEVRQDVYEGLGWETLHERFDEVMSSAYSVSLFTTWGPDGIDQVWRKGVVAGDAPGPTFLDAVRATRALHPLAGISAENSTEQLGLPGPWNERLPHFRLGFRPSNGDELQSEYIVPRRHAVAAIEALRGIADVVVPLLQVSEIRTIAADDLWLSPTYREDGVGLHFTWKPLPGEVAGALRVVEEALAPFEPRPHWGKVFAAPAVELAGRYPRFADFRALADRLDPERRFRGGYVEELLG